MSTRRLHCVSSLIATLAYPQLKALDALLANIVENLCVCVRVLIWVHYSYIQRSPYDVFWIREWVSLFLGGVKANWILRI